MVTDAISMTGYSHFWEIFRKRFPEIYEKVTWYEVFIDFTDDEYRPNRTLNWNLKRAKKYLEKHYNDYD